MPHALCASLGALALYAIGGAAARAAIEPTVPRPLGYVSDYAHVLQPATVQRLAALIQELKNKTGGEIAVVVVDSTQPLEPFDYAMKIAEAWQPGAKRIDNGVVFLVAVRDRKLFILTGYGVEGVLPDGKVGEIRDQIVRPAFRRGDYDGGIAAATETMAEIIARSYGVQLTGVPAHHPTPPRVGVGGLIPLLLLIIIAIVVFRGMFFPLLIGPRPRMWGGGYGGWGGGGFGGFGGGTGGGAGGDW